MGLATALLLQGIAHLGADYFLQSQRQADEKNSQGFRSKFLIWHALIVFLLSWILSFQLLFVIGAAIIAITHYLIDGLKALVNSHPILRKYTFYVDQLLHLAVIIIVVSLFDHWIGINPLFDFPFELYELAVIVAYLVCLKPANVFIKEVFYTAQLQITSTNELPNAGKLIGVLERLLTLTFMLIGQFEAVGFLIAAKSVLRYRDDETLKTEYVLIGTMLSFGMAILMGILVGMI